MRKGFFQSAASGASRVISLPVHPWELVVVAEGE